MRAKTIGLGWLLLAAAAGCNDDDPRPDPGECEAGRCDAAPAPSRDAGPDAAPVPDADAAAADAAADAAPLPCDIDAALFEPEPPRGLRDTVVRATLQVGGPVAPGQLRVQNLDDDEGGRLERLVARGGRVEMYRASLDPVWRSEVLDLDTVEAVTDLDGDGRREVVASGPRTLVVLDGLTGARAWSLPEQPFGPEAPPLSNVGRVLLADLDADGALDLYVTDAGCGGGGTGDGVVYDFVDGAERPRRRAVQTGNRRGGRCARWQTLADLDGDRRLELIVNDADGLQVLDPLNERLKACGRVPDGPAAGQLPHFVRALRPEAPPSVLVFVETRIVRLDLRDDVAGCPEGRALGPTWDLDLAQPVRPEGAGLLAVDADEVLDVVVSAYDAEAGRWSTRALSGADGRTLAVVDDAVLLGVVGERALVARGETAAIPRAHGTLQWLDARLTPVGDPVEGARPLRAHPRATRVDATEEFTPLLRMGDAVPLLRAAASGALEPEALELGGRALPLAGAPGAAAPVPGVEAFGLARADGAVSVLDAELTELAEPAPTAPAGRPRLAYARSAEGGVLLALAQGALIALDAEQPRTPVRWRRPLGPGNQSAGAVRLRDPEGDRVLVRLHTDGPETWAAIDAATGAVSWRHRPQPGWLAVRGVAVVEIAGAATQVLRHDVLVETERLQPADCEVEHRSHAGDALTAPAEACPERPVVLHAVSALDPREGRCLWRTVVRPTFPCAGPANQTVSVADADGDGEPEIFLTETDAVRRLELDGALALTRSLQRDEEDRVRGGGWLRATGTAPPLLRVGGNGPIEALEADLQLAWRAENPEGQRVQAWVLRDALVVEDEAWVSAGAGQPIRRYVLASDGRPVERPAIGLLDGRRVEPGEASANIGSLAWIADLLDAGVPGVAVTADDGWLYALTPDGDLAWTRRYPAVIGPPLAVDVDEDDAAELVVPLGDGRVLVGDQRGPPPPPAVWDLPCPPPDPTCPEDDIDETDSVDRLCAAWIELDAEFEARAVGPNGAVVRDWTPVGPPPARLDGLDLLPGLRYHVEVRSVAEGVSGPAASDGVLVVNDDAPQVSVEVDPPAIPSGLATTDIHVTARDDDLLAGWTLDVQNAEGVLIRRLVVGALATPAFATTRSWDGTDPDKRALAPGVYTVVATFYDRARNVGVGTAALEICPEACE